MQAEYPFPLKGQLAGGVFAGIGPDRKLYIVTAEQRASVELPDRIRGFVVASVHDGERVLLYTASSDERVISFGASIDRMAPVRELHRYTLRLSSSGQVSVESAETVHLPKLAFIYTGDRLGGFLGSAAAGTPDRHVLAVMGQLLLFERGEPVLQLQNPELPVFYDRRVREWVGAAPPLAYADIIGDAAVGVWRTDRAVSVLVRRNGSETVLTASELPPRWKPDHEEDGILYALRYRVKRVYVPEMHCWTLSRTDRVLSVGLNSVLHLVCGGSGCSLYAGESDMYDGSRSASCGCSEMPDLLPLGCLTGSGQCCACRGGCLPVPTDGSGSGCEKRVQAGWELRISF